jgi:nucleoside-diphosphate-sugar epimerase
VRRILITGTSGFIGNYLAQHFLKSGDKVLGLSRQNNEQLQHPNFKWVQHDLSLGKPDLADVGVCIHAAAQSPAPGVSTSDFVNHNVVATKNLLRALQESGCRKIIFLSGVSVYGEVDTPEVNEQTQVINSDSYGLSKLLAERILQEQDAIHVCILRLPGVLGRGAVTPWLVRQIHKAIRNESITVYNPDGFFNNAVWLEDLVDFIQQLTRDKFDKHQIFLLGTETQLSIRSMMELIKDRTQSESKINYFDGNTSFTLDISSAMKAGFKTCSLEKLLVQQIDIEFTDQVSHATD